MSGVKLAVQVRPRICSALNSSSSGIQGCCGPYAAWLHGCMAAWLVESLSTEKVICRMIDTVKKSQKGCQIILQRLDLSSVSAILSISSEHLEPKPSCLKSNKEGSTSIRTNEPNSGLMVLGAGRLGGFSISASSTDKGFAPASSGLSSKFKQCLCLLPPMSQQRAVSSDQIRPKCQADSSTILQKSGPRKIQQTKRSKGAGNTSSQEFSIKIADVDHIKVSPWNF